MSYEYNHSIQFDLDHLSQYEDVIDLDEKKIEFDEVYAKARVFDYIKGIKDEVEADIYKSAVVREESAYQYLGCEVVKFMNEYESDKQP